MNARPRIPVFVAGVIAAYVIAWLADAMLNDDVCFTSDLAVPDGSSFEGTRPWWRGWVDCRVTMPSGAVVSEPGDPTVFLAVFGFWVIVAIVVVVRLRWFVRLPIVVVAWLLAVAAIFV